MAELRAQMQAARERRAATRPPPKFAKWLANGELQCLLCGAHVRSEALWPAHLQSAQHQKAVLEWKKKALRQAAAGARNAPEAEADAAGPRAQAFVVKNDALDATKSAIAAAAPGAAAGAPSTAGAEKKADNSGYSSSEDEGAAQSSKDKDKQAAPVAIRAEAGTVEAAADVDDGGIKISIVAKMSPSSTDHKDKAGVKVPYEDPEKKSSTKADLIRQRILDRLAAAEAENQNAKNAAGGVLEGGEENLTAKRRKVVGPMLIDNFDVDDMTVEEIELAASAMLSSSTGSTTFGGSLPSSSSAAATSNAAGVSEKKDPQAELPKNTNVPANFFDDKEEEADAKGVTKPSILLKQQFENDLRRLDIEADREHRENMEKRNALASERYRKQQEEEGERRAVRLKELKEIRGMLDGRKEERAGKDGGGGPRDTNGKGKENVDVGEEEEEEESSSEEEYEGLDWRCG